MSRSTVFGLDVRCATPLSFLAAAGAPATGRSLTVGEAGEFPAWPDRATLISDERQPDGAVNFQIEADVEGGFRFSGPAFGESILSADASRLWGDPGEAGIDGWQRLLVAQVLPFAAVLQGLEVLHASGVSTATGAVALVGASGTGKTSLALALERAGVGEMLADDVLALERGEDSLLAHPGAPVAAVARGEARRLRGAGVALRGEPLAFNEREEVSSSRLASRSAPLRALFFLDPRPDGPPTPRFVPEPDPQRLLAATFNLVLASPDRLAGLLDVCARLGRLRVERITWGPRVDPSHLARALRTRLGEGS